MSAELPFSPDFAARVLRAADAVTRRRRAAAAAVFLLAGGVLAASLLRPASAPPRAWPDTDLEIAATDGLETEPVDYMFPDAAPLAQFSERYSDTGETGDDE
jgi:hypothetical protein